MILNSVLLSGAGNTFHIFYNVDKSVLPQAKLPALVRDLCDKDPADGVVFLDLISEEQQKYKWDFYNNDGSHAEMCGNATRCVGYFAEHILQSKTSDIKLETACGEVQIQILGETSYKVFMPRVEIFKHANLFYCNTGVPHVVIEIPSTDRFENWKAQCEKMRNSAEFQPHGTNVTLLMCESGHDHVLAVTFERGVEDFTLACGTGAIAAALFMSEKYKNTKTSVEMPGGTLNIDLSDYNNPIMVGLAEYLEDCTYEFIP